MKIYFITLIHCLIPFILTAQPSADSLFNRLNSSDSKEKVDIYLAIAKVYWRYSTDSIHKYSIKALNQANQIGYTNGEAKALAYIGVTHFYRADYDSVLYYYNQAVNKFKESNDFSGVAITTNNTGVLYRRMGEYTKALQCYNEALAIQDSLGDIREVGGILLNIGNIHGAQSKLDSSLNYYLKALEKFESIHDKVKIASAYTNIGEVYAELEKNDKALEFYHKALLLQKESDDKYGAANTLSNIGIINKKCKNYSESENNLKQSARLFIEMEDMDAIAYVYNHLGELYALMKQWDKALDFYTKTLQINESIGDDEGIAFIKLYLANLYFQKKEWIKAEKNLDEGIELGKKLHMLDMLQKSYLLFSRIDSARGRNSEALEHFKTYSFYKDTIYNEESSRQIAEMETKYETAKKEQSIEQLRQEKILRELEIKNNRIIGASSMAVLIVSFILLFILYQSKQRKQRAKLLLKNTMETEDKERKYFAEELHDGIGPLLSTVKMYVNELDKEPVNSSTQELLIESNKILDEAISSARNLSHSLMPQNITEDGLIKSLHVFADRICLHGEPALVFDTGKTSPYGEWQQVVIYRIITELITNSIKHASTNLIKLSMNEDEKTLSIIYEDDGKGFDVEKALKKSDGIGLINIISRVNLLDGTVVFLSKPEQGFKSRMTFELKNLYDNKLV